MNELSGKSAVVLGGTSSIGLEVAKLFSGLGINVTAVGRHKPAESFKNINFLLNDFLKDGIDSINKEPLSKLLENVDIVCVCYGPFVKKSLHEVSVQEWEELSLMDYALPGAVCSKVLNSMQKRKWGRIILFGGTRTDSIRNYKTTAAYSGLKTGLGVLVKSIASEYREYGITCNAVLPGFTRNAPDKDVIISTGAVAECVVRLIENPIYNGVLLNIDKGWAP